MVAKSSWHTSKWAIISFHVLAWMAWFSLPYFMQLNMGPQQRFRPTPEMMEQMAKISGQPSTSMMFRRPPDDRKMLEISFIQNVFLVIVFYLNTFKLLPSLMFRGKKWQYVGLIISLLIIYSVGTHWLHMIGNSEPPRGFFGPRLFSSFSFVFIIALSITYRVVSDKIISDQLQKEKENANLKTELSFLRSQISPHFMFNVLNNMVALARKRSDELEPSLIKLSGLMRYMLYEADTDKVPVEKELDYLKSYVELQKQRFAGSVDVSLNIDNDESMFYIEPMLLIPFVENAFKHGMGLVTDPRIIISLQVNNGTLLMEVRNRFNKISGEIKDKTSGIGLSNVKRRLDLLYQKNHSLLISSQDEWFNILLQLKLT